MTGKRRFEDKEFVGWVRRRGGVCCVCRALEGDNRPAAEPHHFDYRNRGVGLKGRDHWLARLCRSCHEKLQGKGRAWFVQNNELETWTAMLEDAMNLMSDYILEKGLQSDLFSETQNYYLKCNGIPTIWLKHE